MMRLVQASLNLLVANALEWAFFSSQQVFYWAQTHHCRQTTTIAIDSTTLASDSNHAPRAFGKRFISVSIHPTISLCTSFTGRPAVSINGPIDTVILPACLIQGFFGQHSPALCAIGIMGAFNDTAKRAPPYRNLLDSPGAIRVPSGNMIIHTPSAKRTRA